MPDPTPPPVAPQPGSTRSTDSDRVLAVVNYVLFLVGPANGLTMLIAGILAYVRRDQTDGWITSHYTYQIYTLWYGLGIFLVGLLTIVVFGLGFLVLALGTIWVILRAAIGLVRLVDGRPHPDPRSFLF